MKFYNILQMNPGDIKKLIGNTDDDKEIMRLKFGMGLRSVLIILFAIAFIAPLSSLFGSENNAMAVAIFCILLGVRFVDFGYRIEDALLNLAIVFLILLLSPVAAYYVNPIIGLIIHFISFMVILLITCDRPEMGNGGLFSFSYIFLAGNPVSGEILYNRFLMMCVGLVICGAIFFVKHRHKHTHITFKEKIKEIDIYSHKHHWQIKMALGIRLILTMGRIFNIERFMWAGFACGSLLADHNENPRLQEKFIHRVIGVMLGSLTFYVIYSIIPESMHMLIGPIGGFCLGFCADYKYKTAMNCFGALMLAAQVYGLHSAIMLRITDNLIGIIFAVTFYYFYELIIGKRFKALSE